MTIIILLIAISLTLAVTFLVLFLWNLKNGQYDDTYSPAARILFDNKTIDKIQRKNHDRESSFPGNTTKKV